MAMQFAIHNGTAAAPSRAVSIVVNAALTVPMILTGNPQPVPPPQPNDNRVTRTEATSQPAAWQRIATAIHVLAVKTGQSSPSAAAAPLASYLSFAVHREQFDVKQQRAVGGQQRLVVQDEVERPPAAQFKGLRAIAVPAHMRD